MKNSMKQIMTKMMKHHLKNSAVFLLSFLAVSLLFFGTPAARVSAAPTAFHLTLCVEGIDSNMFYKTVDVPVTDSLTLQNALSVIDAGDDSITIDGVSSGFISGINGEMSGNFGGWDGWMYKVNGTEPAVGIQNYMLADGDQILLYYGDPFGVGMQFPVADTTGLKNGILRFTSTDTTYDESWNPVVTVNPVVGMTVTWHYGESSAAYTTDADGRITIDPAQLIVGDHIVQVSKVSESGIPLVLRLTPGYTVTVEAAAPTSAPTVAPTAVPTTTPAISSSSSDGSNTNSSAQENPVTGNQADPVPFFLLISSSVILAAVLLRNRFRRVYEK